MRAAVLGAGSWGTALAAVLCRNGHQTVLWGRRPETVEEIRKQRTNSRYLPDAVLPAQLTATTDLAAAVRNAELVVFVVPSSALSSLVQEVRSHLPRGCILAHAIKGFDPPTRRRMSEVIIDGIEEAANRVCAICGPSHAEEVIRELPTTLVIASRYRAVAETVQDALMNSVLRVYTNPDIVGAEVGGSLKNIIALGVGIADGLGFGDNAKAALMTRGLAEITRLGVKMGASPLTFSGLSGVGDLVVTCTSRHSRNFRAGQLLGQGVPAAEAIRRIGMAVEGIPATRAAMELRAEYDVEMPITEALYQVLFAGLSPREAVSELMGRAKSHEIEEVAREALTPEWL
jgi:glycerol-3-phosphate dehydrogenase (NAD(P)+)